MGAIQTLRLHRRGSLGFNKHSKWRKGNKMTRILNIKAALACATTLLASFAAVPAGAADAEACKTIRLSDPGWTDITATNGVAAFLLKTLGYEPDVKTLSVPIGYQSMKNGEIDVFLGNWLPSQQSFIDDLNAAKAAEVLNRNLE